MNLDALFKLAERLEWAPDFDVNQAARVRNQLDPSVPTRTPGSVPLSSGPRPRPPRFSGLRRWGGRAAKAGLLGGGLALAGRYLWDKVPSEFTVTPEEQLAQRTPAKAKVGPAPVAEAGIADQPSNIWGKVKDTWSGLPSAAKWGVGAAGAGLATYLLYRLLRDNSDDR